MEEVSVGNVIDSKNILRILAFSLIYVFIYLTFYSQNFKDYLDLNWNQIKCNPKYIFFAGITKSAEGDGYFSKTYNNFNQCTTGIISNMLKVITVPLFAIIGGIVKAIKSIANILNSFRTMAKVIRDMYSVLVESVYQKMGNTFSGLIYLQEKLKSIVQKQSAVFEVLSQFFATMPFMFYSITNGPIPRFAYWLSKYIGVLIAFIIICFLCWFGGPFVSLFACPVCYLCFAGDTIIETAEGKKSIRDIKIGDKIGKSTVLGMMKMKKDNYTLFDYKNVKVSGTHTVFHNYKWIRIQDIENLKSNTMNTDLICLITDNQRIVINDITFGDYREINNKETETILHNFMMQNINNKIDLNVNLAKSKKHTYYWGFSKNTRVMYDNKSYKIEDLYKYNDNLVGKVCIKDKDIKWYSYNGIIVSGNTLILQNNKWIRVYELDLVEVDYKDELFNIVVDNNILSVLDMNGNTVLFRDFVETKDNEINEIINNCLIEELNNN